MNRWPLRWAGVSFKALPQLLRGGRRGRAAAEFLRLYHQLRETQTKLEQASRGLEAQFLTTGTELEKLTALGHQFVSLVERLVSLATGKECDRTVFSNAIRLIEHSTAFLVRCHEETARMLSLLRHYNSQIESLLGVEAELQRTLLPLKFMQTLFQSESAPLGLEVQQVFNVLTKEIGGLHSQVRDIFGTKFQQLEQTHQTIGRVIQQLEAQAGALHQATTIHKAQIEASLESLKQEMAANQDRDVRLDRLSKDLAREVEQVVMGLQFQDIINQKLQHVTAALPPMEQNIAGFKQAPDVTAAGQLAQFLHQSCRLEAGQLLAAQEELAKAESTIQGAIRTVLAHLTQVDSKCLSLDEFKLLTTSWNGMVQILVETIEDVRNLVAATVASAAEAHEMLRPLGSLASDLTAVVHGMSAQIHLIGLNAQVQAAQAARDRRGAGLEVLSARTSEISEETNRISRLASNQLDQLAAGLAECVDAFGKLRADGLAQQAALNQQGRIEEGNLHAFRDQALEALRAIGTSLDDIQQQARQTLASVRFSSFHSETIPAMRTALGAIADRAEAWLQWQGVGLAQTNLVEAFKRDYTMASEREVFADVIPALTPRTVPSEADLCPTPAGGEAADRTEQAPDATLAQATAASPVGGDLGGNVELF